MNDPARATLWAALQAELLIVSAILIGFYLCETWKMRKASQAQLEVPIRPALAVFVGLDGRELRLVNLGKGPALHVRLSPADRGSAGARDLERWGEEIGFISPEDPPRATCARTQGAGINVLNGKSLQCEYKSLSGRTYWTVADFDKFDNSRLLATRFYSEDSFIWKGRF